jgi:hypothetical protein
MKRFMVIGLVLVFGFVLAGCPDGSGSTDTPTEYTVEIGTLANGAIEASPTKGVAGTEITLTVTPATNYKLKAGSLMYGATAIDESLKFKLPAANVTVTAVFELTTPEPEFDEFYTFTDELGNTIKFLAEEGFDTSAALVILQHPGNQAFIGFYAPFIASITLKSNVEGGRDAYLGSDGRAVIVSDGSDIIGNDISLGANEAFANGPRAMFAKLLANANQATL